MTSAMKETMLAVSRTVSPCAIWLFFSSRSCGVNPSRLQEDANENLVLVELSRKIELFEIQCVQFPDKLLQLSVHGYDLLSSF